MCNIPQIFRETFHLTSPKLLFYSIVEHDNVEFSCTYLPSLFVKGHFHIFKYLFQAATLGWGGEKLWKSHWGAKRQLYIHLKFQS